MRLLVAADRLWLQTVRPLLLRVEEAVVGWLNDVSIVLFPPRNRD